MFPTITTETGAGWWQAGEPAEEGAATGVDWGSFGGALTGAGAGGATGYAPPGADNTADVISAVFGGLGQLATGIGQAVGAAEGKWSPPSAAPPTTIPTAPGAPRPIPWTWILGGAAVLGGLYVLSRRR